MFDGVNLWRSNSHQMIAHVHGFFPFAQNKIVVVSVYAVTRVSVHKTKKHKSPVESQWTWLCSNCFILRSVCFIICSNEVSQWKQWCFLFTTILLNVTRSVAAQLLTLTDTFRFGCVHEFAVFVRILNWLNIHKSLDDSANCILINYRRVITAIFSIRSHGIQSCNIWRHRNDGKMRHGIRTR